MVCSIHYIMCYPNLKNEDPTSIKVTTENVKINELKDKNEEHDFEIFFRSVKIGNEY